MSTFRKYFVFATILAIAFIAYGQATAVSAQMAGAIFTTNSLCDGTDLNIYSAKSAVYVDGGPAHPGAAGLPDGEYYIKVTEPDGTLLGTSIGSGDETPVVVVNGEFVTCYQLQAVVIKFSNGTPGYDTTTNGGGEYKVWVSSVSSFAGAFTKTDNFKVKGEDVDCQENCEPPQEEAALHVRKYYDANLNGEYDDGEALLPGWLFRIQDGMNFLQYTPIDIIVEPDQYTVTEFMPNESNWIGTDPGGTEPFVKQITLADGDDETLYFGNVCIGAGGGHTLGYWSNKNGKATMNDGGTMFSEFALLNGLNLVDATGGPAGGLDGFTNYEEFRAWLLNGTAVNMSYMLSVQLAAMELNVEAGFVQGDALIYAPDVTGANEFGFISINDLMTAANNALGADSETFAGDANRAYQEILKDALDDANNNLNFLQPDASTCPYTFTEPVE